MDTDLQTGGHPVNLKTEIGVMFVQRLWETPEAGGGAWNSCSLTASDGTDRAGSALGLLASGLRDGARLLLNTAQRVLLYSSSLKNLIRCHKFFFLVDFPHLKNIECHCVTVYFPLGEVKWAMVWEITSKQTENRRMNEEKPEMLSLIGVK